MSTIDLSQPPGAELQLAYWRGSLYAEALVATDAEGNPTPWPAPPTLRFKGHLDATAVLDESGTRAAWLIEPEAMRDIPAATPVTLVQMLPNGMVEYVYGSGLLTIYGDA